MNGNSVGVVSNNQNDLLVDGVGSVDCNALGNTCSTKLFAAALVLELSNSKTVESPETAHELRVGKQSLVTLLMHEHLCDEYDCSTL